MISSKKIRSITATLGSDDLEFEIDFDYQKRERETLEYPGCYAEATITEIRCDGEEMDISSMGSEIIVEAYEKINEALTGENDE